MPSKLTLDECNIAVNIHVKKKTELMFQRFFYASCLMLGMSLRVVEFYQTLQSSSRVVSFPGLSCLQFLITCSIQKGEGKG